MLAGCLVAERSSALVGVTLCTGLSDTESTIGVASIGAGFALCVSSSISHCACCRPIKVGANWSIILLRAWNGCVAGGEVASLWPNVAWVSALSTTSLLAAAWLLALFFPVTDLKNTTN